MRWLSTGRHSASGSCASCRVASASKPSHRKRKAAVLRNGGLSRVLVLLHPGQLVSGKPQNLQLVLFAVFLPRKKGAVTPRQW